MAKATDPHPQQLELKVEGLIEMIEALAQRAQRQLTPLHKDAWPARPASTVETGDYL